MSEQAKLQIWDESNKTRYCVNCGSAVSVQWKYCQNCGAPTSVNVPTLTSTANRSAKKEQHSEKTTSSYTAIGIVLVVVVLAIILWVQALNTISYESSKENDVTASQPSAAVRTIATPEPKKYTRAFIQNGELLTRPSYERTCPLTVSVPSGKNNYYIYLRYLHAPAHSVEARTPTLGGYGGSTGNTDDLSFYVKAGKSVSLDVPIGVYKLSYACGENWYGAMDLFGDDTLYYSSNDTLSFYADGEYYNGHTLELWLQQNGNFDRRAISASQFPA